MAFLTEVSAARYFRASRHVGEVRIDHPRLRPFVVSTIKQACEIGAALVMIAAIMTALAFFELWIWLPTLPN
jgi:hypothetical protein